VQKMPWEAEQQLVGQQTSASGNAPEAEVSSTIPWPPQTFGSRYAFLSPLVALSSP
jgi:hypothetical protein